MSEAKLSASLQLAVEEKEAPAELAGLRDRLIAHALAEGESVSDVAAALNLSEPTVFKVKEALNREHAPTSADLQATGERLENFTDHIAFEAMVATLMEDVEPGSIPLGGVADRGRDGTNLDNSVVWTISLARQWARKVRADLGRIAEEGFEPRRVYAVTNRRTTRAAVERLEKEAAENGIALTVLNQRWLIAKLTHPDYIHLRGTHLGLARPHGRVFLPAGDYRELLDGRPHLFGFDIAFVGREREIGRVSEALEDEGSVLLIGAGGLGKTRLALRMAEQAKAPWYFLGDAVAFTSDALAELLVSPDTTVVIDNAHRRRDLGQIVAALSNLEHRPRLLLIARPGFTDTINQALGGLWTGPFGRANTVELGGLSWEEMSELLRTESLNVQSDGMRGTLIQLSEGNPQIAVIGATVARERKSVSELSSSELLQTYVIYLIPTAIPKDADLKATRRLLAVVAALAGIDEADEQLMAAVADMAGESTRQLEDKLELLADGGLLIREGTTYRIKPDLLSEHVLFALTLSEKWDPAVPYGQIFERFAPEYLRRLVGALGELPPGLIDDDVRARLWPVEHALDHILSDGEPLEAAELIRDVARGFPEIAFPRGKALLKQLVEGNDLPGEVIETLREAAMRNGNFEMRWKLLLGLSAASSADPELIDKIGESMAEVYQHLPDDGSEDSGRVLAWVQHTLAEQTTRFWERRPSGAAVAVALSIRPMLTLAFEVNRQSADTPMALTLGTRLVPESDYTRKVVNAGTRLAAQIFGQLDPHWQLKLLETLGGANNAASGYTLAYGAQLDTWARALLDKALTQVDVELASRLEDLSMPVQAEAYSLLLKRVATRKRLLETLEEEAAARQGSERHEKDGTEEKLSSVSAPIPSAALEQYIFLIHQGEVGPPEDALLAEEQERTDAQTVAIAEALLDSPDWRQLLDRWTRWCEETRAATGEVYLGSAPAMVLREAARRDPTWVKGAIGHLIATESELRGSSAAAMVEIFEAGGKAAIEDWLAADPTTKAALASALAGRDHELARRAMREMVLCEDEATREAALQALIFARSLSKWDIDLALEALVRTPKVETLSRLLHIADHHAEAEGSEGYVLDAEQIAKVRSAALATARQERLSGFRLADMLERAARQLSRLPIDWVLARLEFLDRLDRTEMRLQLWRMVDELPNEISGLVKRSAEDDDLARAVELFYQFSRDSYALPDVATLIRWLDPGAEAVTDLIVELLGRSDRRYGARSNLLGLPLTDEQRDRRAERIAQSVEDPLDPLVDLLDGTLPRFWSGSRLPALESALAHARRWSKSEDDPDLREAGQKAASQFERMIKSERRDEEAEKRRFAYR